MTAEVQLFIYVSEVIFQQHWFSTCITGSWQHLRIFFSTDKMSTLISAGEVAIPPYLVLQWPTGCFSLLNMQPCTYQLCDKCASATACSQPYSESFTDIPSENRKLELYGML